MEKLMEFSSKIFMADGNSVVLEPFGACKSFLARRSELIKQKANFGKNLKNE